MVRRRRACSGGLRIFKGSAVAAQITVAPGPACARKSALEGLPGQLVAGQAADLTIRARDASGSAVAGGDDAVEVLIDSAAEGHVSVPVKVNSKQLTWKNRITA